VGLRVKGAGEWRTVCDLYKYFSERFLFSLKPNKPSILRFNPIQISEWMDQLCRRSPGNPRDKVQTLSEDLGVVECRVIQFLNLLRFPADLRARLRQDPRVAEGQLRPFTKMTLATMRTAIERLLGLGALSQAG
jgi:hypothetical protein